jgi:hypothetical protein
LENEIDRQRNAWGNGYVGGTHLATVMNIDARTVGMLDAARRLNHAVVINAHSDGVKFYALPLGKR